MTEPPVGEIGQEASGHDPRATSPEAQVDGGAPPISSPRVRPSRAGRAWVAIIVGIVVLALLLVFIFQNLHDTTVHFFSARGSLPVALALLFAALAGAAVVLLVGSVRIIQLRRHVRASYLAGARRSRRPTRSGGASAPGPGPDEG